MVQNTLKNSLALSYKHLPYDPGNPFLGINPRKMKTCSQEVRTNVRGNFIHDSPKLETTQMFHQQVTR